MEHEKQSIINDFQLKIADAGEQSLKLKAKLNQLGIVRLVSFICLIVLVTLLTFEVHIIAGVVAFVLGILFFNFLIGRFQDTQKELKWWQRKQVFFEEEQKLSQFDFNDFDGGEQYKDSDHPFAGDLDLFGKHSIWQFINRTKTQVGSDALADYLKHPLQDVEQIKARQEAIKELAQKLDWRAGFAAHGDLNNEVDIKGVIEWVEAPVTLQASYLKWLPILVGLFNIAWSVACFYLPMYAIVVFGITFWILNRYKERVDAIHEHIQECLPILKQYAQMIGAIVDTEWESQLLQDLKKQFSKEDIKSAQSIIEDLSYNARQLDVQIGRAHV